MIGWDFGAMFDSFMAAAFACLFGAVWAALVLAALWVWAPFWVALSASITLGCVPIVGWVLTRCVA
jgi:hypothetical protein